ncbi:MAG: hypothetical protein DI535_17850 [Citrobacter freundii]|nr:MAG: hypothetical protein DI535_17850 [Citrobacter freundii]
MSRSKIRQLEYESNTWKRQIALMVDENIYMKARLVEILREQERRSSLEAAEGFQNEFIEQDSVISVLKNGIAEFDRLLKRERFEDGMLVNAVFVKHKHLEDDLSVAKKKFEELKIRFNKHILDEH